MDELISQPKNNLTTRKLSCGPAQARRRNLHLGRKSTVHTVRPSLACMHAWWREAQAQESLPGPPQSSKACRTKHKPGRPRAVETRSGIVTIVYLSLRPCHRISVCLTIMGSVNIRYQRFEPHNLRFSWPLPGSKPHQRHHSGLGCLATRGSNLAGCGVPGSRASSPQEPRSWLSRKTFRSRLLGLHFPNGRD